MRIPTIAAAVVAGVPVDDVTMEETVDLIDEFVKLGRSTGRTFQVATINVDFVVNAQHDTDLMRILRGTELGLPDGMPIVWYARLSGTVLRSRVAGADLVPALVDRSRSTGARILLFGSAEGVAESATTLLTERYPGAVVRGMSGPILADARQMDRRWVDEIVAFHPDIVCVALGNPKQERWIDAHRGVLGASVLIGVGGTLDFLVGGRRRAPQWMRHSGLEWVYRAAQEPRRLGRRYAHDSVVFGPHIVRAGVSRLRSGHSASAVSVVVDPASGDVVADSGGRQMATVDIARLVGLARDARRAGSRVVLTNAGHGAERAARDLGVYGAFDFR